MKHLFRTVAIIVIISVFTACKSKEDTAVVLDEAVCVFHGHNGWVTSVAFSPDGTYALSSSIDKTVRLWQVKDAKEVVVFRKHKSRVWSVAYSPNGNYAVSAGSKSIRLWNINTKRQVRVLARKSFFSKGFDRVTFSPNGEFILSSGGLCFRDIQTGGEQIDFNKLPFWGIEDIALSPDGKLVVAVCWWKKKIQLWDATTGKKLGVLGKHQGWGNAVAFTPDSKYVLSAGFDGTLILWDVSTRRMIRDFRGYTTNVWSLAISPDGKYALSGGDDAIVHLWEILTGEEIKTFTGHTPGHAIYSVAFSPDGRFALSGCQDHTLRLWDISKDF